jgi:hypothetical protein
MAIPIVVSCPCGIRTQANAGDVVTCTCGRRYDTATAGGPDQLAAALIVQRRHKVYAWLGICIAGLAAVGGFLLAGFWGAGVALPLSCLVWWKGVQPRWARRAAADLASLPTTRVEATPPRRFSG